MKRIIAGIMMVVMCIVGISGMRPIKAKAEIIKPEIIRTEEWTTSYFIDNDTKTLYPYINCQADIYNDGTVKVVAWNTHEWTGFATVNHTATFIEANPIKYSVYCKGRGKSEKYNYNFYPDEYNMGARNNWGYNSEYIEKGTWTAGSIDIITYSGTLPRMTFSEEKAEHGHNGHIITLTFTPIIEPTDTYNFKIYGHEFTITPDLLQSTSMPEPPVNEADALRAEIAALKAENESLKTQLNFIQKDHVLGDVDGDNFVDARDASAILGYYAWLSTGNEAISIDNYLKMNS